MIFFFWTHVHFYLRNGNLYQCMYNLASFYIHTRSYYGTIRKLFVPLIRGCGFAEIMCVGSILQAARDVQQNKHIT